MLNTEEAIRNITFSYKAGEITAETALDQLDAIITHNVQLITTNFCKELT